MGIASQSLESIKAGKGPITAQGITFKEVRCCSRSGQGPCCAERCAVAVGAACAYQRSHVCRANNCSKPLRPSSSPPHPHNSLPPCPRARQAQLKTFATALERVAAAIQAAPTKSELALKSFEFGQNALAGSTSKLLGSISKFRAAMGNASPAVKQMAGAVAAAGR